MKSDEEIEREEQEGEEALGNKVEAMDILVIVLLLIMAGILTWMNSQPIHP